MIFVIGEFRTFARNFFKTYTWFETEAISNIRKFFVVVFLPT